MTEVNTEKRNDIANVILKINIGDNKYYDPNHAVTDY
jgi:hypothetical protein